MELDISVSEKVARLRHTLLFGGCGPEALRALAHAADVVNVDQGSEVVREGDLGDALYVVTRGLLRARRRLADGRQELLGDLNKGGFFGEFGLIEACPRTATVEAVTASQLLRLSRSGLEPHLAAHPELAERIGETLRLRREALHVPFRPSAESLRDTLAALFGGLERSAQESLGKEIEWLWLPAGGLLLSEGEPGDAVYFVLDGRVRVFTQGPRGVELTIGEVGRGESVGEMALLWGAPRSASAVAVLDTQFLRLSAEGFDNLLAEHPEALASFRGVMLTRIARRARAEALSARSQVRRPLTLEDCESVMRTRDLVLRNLKITHSYHRLALDLVEVMGPENVNWLAFGAHASKTAGYAIRKEEVPFYEVYEALARTRRLGPLLRQVGTAIAQSFVARQADQMMERVSQAISDGNLRIFADMAPVIVRFLELVRVDAQYDAEKIAAFRASLRPGPPERDGQDLLGQALASWYEAMHEPDPKRRAELVLLGNARMGLHEQIRVQPDVEEALGAALRHRLGDDLGLLLEEHLRAVPRSLRFGLRKGADAVEPVVLDAVATGVRRMITRRMMRLRLPYESVWLGSDVPMGPSSAAYPPELREIAHPDLQALLARYAPRADNSTAGTAAVDWTSLEQRMNFIVHLFRSRQKSLELFSAPLAVEQLVAIEEHTRKPPPSRSAPQAEAGSPGFFRSAEAESASG